MYFDSVFSTSDTLDDLRKEYKELVDELKREKDGSKYLRELMEAMKKRQGEIRGNLDKEK